MSNVQPPVTAVPPPAPQQQPQQPPPNYAPPPHTTYTIQNQPGGATHDGKSSMRPVPGVKYFGITTIIVAFLLCIFGIVAIVIEAKDAYVGNAIWTGVLFVLPTGLLALTSYWKRESLCTNVAYLVVSMITCVLLAILVIYASINAVRERYDVCQPEPGYDYYYWRDWEEDGCPFTWGSRMGINVVITLLALFQFVLCIIAMACTCYGTCSCCFYCCKGASPPAMIQYNAQNGACQLVAVGGYQSPTAYQPVSLVVPVGTPGGQMLQQQAIPVMAHPQMQSHQPVLIAASSGLPSATQTQHVTPAVTGNTQATALPEKTPEKRLPSESSDHAVEQDNLAYGQTASEYFNDEQNLI